MVILTHSMKSNLKQRTETSAIPLHAKATKHNFNIVGAAVFGGNCLFTKCWMDHLSVKTGPRAGSERR